MAYQSVSVSGPRREQRQYGSYQLGGKSIALVASYGVDTRPTKIGDDDENDILGETNTYVAGTTTTSLSADRHSGEQLFAVGPGDSDIDCTLAWTTTAGPHALTDSATIGRSSSSLMKIDHSDQAEGTDHNGISFEQYFDFDRASREQHPNSTSEAYKDPAAARPHTSGKLVQPMRLHGHLIEHDGDSTPDPDSGGSHTTMVPCSSGTDMRTPSTIEMPEDVLAYIKQNPWVVMQLAIGEATVKERRATSAAAMSLSE